MSERTWKIRGNWIAGTLPGTNPIQISGPVPDEGEVLTITDASPLIKAAEQVLADIDAYTVGGMPTKRALDELRKAVALVRGEP